MEDQALAGGFSDAPTAAARAFRAAMEAMARPGTIQTLTGAEAPAPVSVAAAVLLLTLCDGNTPLHLAPGHDTPAVRNWVTFHTGAPLVDRARAQFALGRWEALLPLADYPVGRADYPDRSATLIVERPSLSEGMPARLAGPGIRESCGVRLPEIAPMQMNNALYPLGLDMFFTAGTQGFALPRSTCVEAL